MKFLIDAQLPPSLCQSFRKFGHEAVHTTELPSGNQTIDSEIIQHIAAKRSILATKDLDFFYSHVLTSRPEKLLLVRTGNLSTFKLRELFENNMKILESALTEFSLVEIDQQKIKST